MNVNRRRTTDEFKKIQQRFRLKDESRQPIDASSLFFMCLFIFYFFYVRKKRGTDRRTDTPSYRDARTHLILLLNFLLIFCSFYMFEKKWGMDRRTDTPSYRNARTHLKRRKANRKNMKKQIQRLCARALSLIPKGASCQSKTFFFKVFLKMISCHSIIAEVRIKKNDTQNIYKRVQTCTNVFTNTSRGVNKHKQRFKQPQIQAEA